MSLKRLRMSHVEMPPERCVRRRVEQEKSKEASPGGPPPTRNRAFVELIEGTYVTNMNSVQFDVESVVGESDEDPASDTDMIDSDAEQDAQTAQEFDEERLSTRSISPGIPTAAASCSIKKVLEQAREVFVGLPPHSRSRSVRHQIEEYEDDDVEMNENSAIIDRSTGLMTPRITRTPSSSIATPPDNDDEDSHVLYEPPEEEMRESSELVDLLREIDPDEDPDEEDKQDDNPVREITDFAIYEEGTMEMLSFWHLALISPEQVRKRRLVASGIVTPQPRVDEQGKEVDIGFDLGDAPRVKLTVILEVDYFWWYDDDERLDTNVWVRTTHAWYILRTPHDLYVPHMRPFTLAHFMVYTMAQYALNNPRASLGSFLDEVDSEEQEELITPTDGTRLEREECELALQDPRVLHIVDELRENARLIRRTSLFRHLEDPVNFIARSRANSIASAIPSDDESVAPPSRGRSRKRRGLKRRKSSKNPELAILEDKNEGTVLTPLVSKIAEELVHFKPARSESVFSARDRQSVSRPPSRRRSSTVHEGNPKKVVWGPCVAQEGQTSFYQHVTIDGVRYEPGDLVMLEPGDDPKKTREEASRIVHTTNKLGHRNWFALIVCLHDGGKHTPSFHGRWFAHSSKTLLQEFSHPNELFWLKECSDCELSSILQKCALDVLPYEGTVGEEEDVADLPDDHFFHRNLYYDEDGVAWTDLPADVLQKALDTCPPHKQCVACGLEELDDRHESIALLDNDQGFITGGIDYHLDECIYLYSEDDRDAAFDLAQIVDWEEAPGQKKDRHSLKLTLTVRFFHRRDDLTRKERLAGIESKDWSMDERHIFLTGREESISSDRLAGKFYLRRRVPKIKDWLLDNPDVFYCTYQTTLAGNDVGSPDELEQIPKNEMPRCAMCFDAMMEHDKELRSVESLQGLEIFAGAGGFSEGMKNMVDTRWKIEFSRACARTLRANHPDCTVYQQDCNSILQHALDIEDGKDPEPLYDDDGTELPPLPKRGEVDIIYGGPPCQSFSKANCYKKDDDPRSMLALVLMSYVELLQPDYVMIENVVGFVEHKVTLQDGRQVSAAMVKIVPRVALALGYQVHARVLQAAQSGVAQGRRRFIIIMARRGLPLPQHPLPTHVHKVAQKVHLPTGQALRGLSRATHGFWTESKRSAYYDEVSTAAPHRMITIEQAISDMPKFHWEQPGVEIYVLEAQRQEENDFRAAGIPVINAVSTRRHGDCRYVGFAKPEKYSDIPRSTYQRVMRSGGNKRVSMHYTMPFTEEAVERVTAVPMRAGANWKDLPAGLTARVKQQPGHRRPNNKMLQRLNADGVFGTSMTSAYPLSRTGSALHYDQRRSLSVRENARAQGFPDSYEFCSASNTVIRRIIEDQQRQIGNAVPVPLARAIGEQSLRPAILARLKLFESSERETPDD